MRIVKLAFVVACGLIVALIAVGTDKKNTQATFNAEESAIVSRAIEIAHGRGLEKGSLPKLMLKKSTLQEWYQIIDFQPGTDAAQLGLDPARPIWIVSMAGQVHWSGPGKQGGKGDHFDNISVAFSVDTLEHIGTVSVSPDKPLPLGLQR